MDYRETLDYLFSQLPMYQRIGPAAYKADLNNTIALSHRLGQPEKNFRSIHIAGTNGKGSVAHMMASVLQEAGYKTGLATSPHLKDFRERIKINGKLIPEDEVTRFVNGHRSFFSRLQPSFFEMAMAMTFHWFAEQKTDIAVIETGMGGRLDSSNIILPELSVITNIGMDHVQFLGPELTDIAREKAGIIKQGIPVVIGQRQAAVQHVFEGAAAKQKTDLTFASDHFSVHGSRTVVVNGRPRLVAQVTHQGKACEYSTDLTGHYQLHNLVTVLGAFCVLNRAGRMKVPHDAIKAGLQNVMENTGLLGRWQQIGRRPDIICDAGHNAEGIGMVFDQLAGIPHHTMRVVFGMVDDKERASIIALLPKQAVYYFCRPPVPRGLDARRLASDAGFSGLRGKAFDTVKEALAAAKKDASPNDLIFVGGSTFVVAEVV